MLGPPCHIRPSRAPGHVSVETGLTSPGHATFQVLSEALRRSLGLSLDDTRHADRRSVLKTPEAENGFVLNRSNHW